MVVHPMTGSVCLSKAIFFVFILCMSVIFLFIFLLLFQFECFLFDIFYFLQIYLSFFSFSFSLTFSNLFSKGAFLKPVLKTVLNFLCVLYSFLLSDA